MKLKDFFKRYPKVALGFSGGVDSVYLLYAAKKYGAEVQPYFVKTSFQPSFEVDDAVRAAKEIGVQLKIISCDILGDARITKNPLDRCYHCKKMIFDTVRLQSQRDGYPLLIDGTNASDKADDRPGIKALAELSVRSPLRECGLTKEKIRALSREAGLFTWNKPAYACLATRIPTDTKITAELLQKVEKAEEELFAMGFSDFRVRVFHGAARLQFTESDLAVAIRKHTQIRRAIEKYFDTILLDLKGR